MSIEFIIIRIQIYFSFRILFTESTIERLQRHFCQKFRIYKFQHDLYLYIKTNHRNFFNKNHILNAQPSIVEYTVTDTIFYYAKHIFTIVRIFASNSTSIFARFVFIFAQYKSRKSFAPRNDNGCGESSHFHDKNNHSPKCEIFG